MRNASTLIALVGVGCGTLASGVGGEPLLIAHVTGAVVSDFKADAMLVVSQPTPGRLNATVLGNSPGASRTESVLLVWNGPELPARGTYNIGPAPADPAAQSGFHALYHAPNTRAESFVSQQGGLTLTEVSANHFAGTFRFTAKKYCEAGTVGLAGSCVPSVVAPSAPEALLEGSFVARSGVPLYDRR